MPMQGSKPSTLSKDLGHIRAQIKSGQTRGNNPRDLGPDEIDALEQKAAALQAEMQKRAKERLVNRINSHTASEATRVIDVVSAEISNATAASDQYFRDVGGEGSVADLRARAAALNKRATEQAKEERKQKAEKEKTAAKERKQKIIDNRKAGRICGICSKVEVEMASFMGHWLCSVCEGPIAESQRGRGREHKAHSAVSTAAPSAKRGRTAKRSPASEEARNQDNGGRDRLSAAAAEQAVAQPRAKRQKLGDESVEATSCDTSTTASRRTKRPNGNVAATGRSQPKLTVPKHKKANPEDYPSIGSPEMAPLLEMLAAYQLRKEGPGRSIFHIPAAKIKEMIGLTDDECDALCRDLLAVPFKLPGDAIEQGRPQWIDGKHAAVGGAGRAKPHSTMFAQTARLEDGVFTNVYGGGSVERFASTCLVDDISPALAKITLWLQNVQESCKLPPANTALLRHYATGEQSIGWHSDNVDNFDKLGLLTIMRLLGARRLPIKVRATGETIFEKLLQPFDLVITTLHANLITEHCVPKKEGDNDGAALAASVSFRTVVDFLSQDALKERLAKLARDKQIKRRKLAAGDGGESSTNTGASSPAASGRNAASSGPRA